MTKEEIDKETAEIISAEIAAFRKIKGLSQAQMAAELDIKQPRLSQLERGLTTINNIPLLKKISAYIGVKASDLRPDLF